MHWTLIFFPLYKLKCDDVIYLKLYYARVIISEFCYLSASLVGNYLMVIPLMPAITELHGIL